MGVSSGFAPPRPKARPLHCAKRPTVEAKAGLSGKNRLTVRRPVGAQVHDVPHSIRVCCYSAAITGASTIAGLSIKKL
jgi:hypothetical protein